MAINENQELLEQFLKELKNPITSNINKKYEESLTIGDRIADRLTEIAGSWNFILFFFAVLVVWVIINVYFLLNPFDPYPFILLNLFLSTLAAFQAPIIMMSQNRQADRDRIQSDFEYLVNLKSEARIQSLHRKVDYLKKEKWDELMKAHQKQTREIKALREELGLKKASPSKRKKN